VKTLPALVRAKVRVMIQVSSPLQSPPAKHAPDWLRNAVVGLEKKQSLDRPLRTVEVLAGKLFATPSVLSTLRGEQIGHAIHPLLTDLPIGAFLSATVLDLTASPRLRPAATVLVGTGLAAVLPTALTGLAEWFVSDTRSKRVGLVHAGVNSTATLCYAASLVCRLRDRHRLGVAFGVAGGALAAVGGYLGGHLSLVRKIGTADQALLSDAESAA
jgi:uncharacterized membrane protein